MDWWFVVAGTERPSFLDLRAAAERHESYRGALLYPEYRSPGSYGFAPALDVDCDRLLEQASKITCNDVVIEKEELDKALTKYRQDSETELKNASQTMDDLHRTIEKLSQQLEPHNSSTQKTDKKEIAAEISQTISTLTDTQSKVDDIKSEIQEMADMLTEEETKNKRIDSYESGPSNEHEFTATLRIKGEDLAAMIKKSALQHMVSQGLITVRLTGDDESIQRRLNFRKFTIPDNKADAAKSLYTRTTQPPDEHEPDKNLNGRYSTQPQADNKADAAEPQPLKERIWTDNRTGQGYIMDLYRPSDKKEIRFYVSTMKIKDKLNNVEDGNPMFEKPNTFPFSHRYIMNATSGFLEKKESHTIRETVSR